MLKSILREPLVHFLLLGAALFVARRLAASDRGHRGQHRDRRQRGAHPQPRAELPPHLAAPADARRNSTGWSSRTCARKCSTAKRSRSGLDRDDTIIRRRLQQKIEFISEEAAALAKPTDEELNAYLKANADAFRVEPRATFLQVYLDPRKRSSTLDADAKRLLAALNGGSASPDPAQLGDRLMMLEHRYEANRKRRWHGCSATTSPMRSSSSRSASGSGPIASGYGVHLVKLESLVAGGTPALAEVRPLVEREWANAKRQEVGKAFYEKLRAKYAIKVQMPEAAKP